MKPIGYIVDCFSPLDFAKAKALRDAGYLGVFRYLGAKTHPEWGKGATPDEVQAIREAGLALWLGWEGNSTSRKYFTTKQAAIDVKEAREELAWLGVPVGISVPFAVDFDAQAADMPAIRQYLDVVRRGLGPYKLAVYGGLESVSNVSADDYFQSGSWSYGKISPRAAVFQSQYNQTDAGVAVDVDEVYHLPHWWPVPNAVVSSLQQGDSGEDVRTLQTDLNRVLGTHLALNAQYNVATVAAVKAFQTLHHLTPDGVYGPITQASLTVLIKELNAAVAKPADKPSPESNSAKQLIIQAQGLLDQAAKLV